MSRSIEEILANIDSATAEELALIADDSFTGEEKGAVQDEVATVATPAASGDATQKPVETQNAEQAPIQTRDGKHTIPYEVLASTRAAKEAAEPQLDFFNYIASLGFQTMIFLGEMPNPITNQVEKNLKQAKFLIDTLVILRDKTKGNLSKEEDDLLNGSIYELQLRYVDLSK